jgi:hypothetical protein
MAIPTTNGAPEVLDYVQSVLTSYLAAELSTRNSDTGLSVQVPDRYRRIESLPEQRVGTDCILVLTGSSTVTRHDAAKRRLSMVTMLAVTAQTAGAMSQHEKFAESLYVLAEAVELVLHSYLREAGGSSTAGVIRYEPENIEYSPPLQLTKGGVWALAANVRGVVHQNPYRITIT